jgi:cytochrome c biogenesis protein CcdA
MAVVGTLLLLPAVIRDPAAVALYYYYLSAPFGRFAGSIGDMGRGTPWPALAALLFGLLGTLAPCQLTGNLAAVSYAARQIGRPGQVLNTVLAFVAGKVTVYVLLGAAIALLGLQLDQSARFVPFVEVVRKAIGPLLIVAGLVMLDALPIRLAAGGNVARWIEQHRPKHGLLAPYTMGVAFSFAFCPTLFWLFFGLTIPLALTSAGGLLFPGVFALGTTLPLLFFAGVIATGADALRLRAIVQRAKRFDVWAQRAVGVVFVLIGLNEIFLYWFI